MPAEKQVEAVSKKLVELNPGFDGKVTPKINDGVVTDLRFLPSSVTDISPVRALTGLKVLDCVDVSLTSRLSDLTPIKGLPLHYVEILGTQVSDLMPLKGMRLTRLGCGKTPVSDLTPLKGMPLGRLNCDGTKVTDISPLKGLPMTHLRFLDTQISDLSPLKDIPVKELHFDFKPDRDTALLRSIKTLETINGKPAAEFWKEVEEKNGVKKQ